MPLPIQCTSSYLTFAKLIRQQHILTPLDLHAALWVGPESSQRSVICPEVPRAELELTAGSLGTTGSLLRAHWIGIRKTFPVARIFLIHKAIDVSTGLISAWLSSGSCALSLGKRVSQLPLYTAMSPFITRVSDGQFCIVFCAQLLSSCEKPVSRANALDCWVLLVFLLPK